VSRPAGNRGWFDAAEQGWKRRRLRSAALIGIVIATIAGTVPLDVGRVSAASAGEALEPVQFVLDDSGFAPTATSAARGQTIWIDNTSSTPRTVTIGGPTLTSGPIPPGGRFVTALPIGGSFTITDDAATPHEATLTIGLPLLPGTPSQNANSQIPDQVAPPVPLDQHPDLTLYLSRNRILIAPTAIASVQQVNDALTANGLIIVGGIQAAQMIVTEPAGASGPTDVVALQAIIDNLRSRPGIRSAAYEFALASTAALPRPVNPDPTAGLPVTPGSEYRNWEAIVGTDGGATGIGSNYGLEASRFPQVWNLLDEIRRRLPGGASTDTVVIDEGFDVTHPDLTGAELERLCTAGNAYCSENRIDPVTGLTMSDHGNAVAATIGAPFDRGDPASRTSLGVVGANPTTDLHLVPADSVGVSTQFLGFFDFMQTFHLVFDRRPIDFPQLRTINLSMGSFFLGDGRDWNRRWATTSCGPGFADDATTPTANRVACTPNTLDAYLVEFRALAEFTRSAAERALGSNVAIVTSAGNQSRQICDVVRAAATDFCPITAIIDSPNVKPLAWIDRTWSSTSGRGSPILVAEAYDFDNRRASYSNRGTITAPGTVVAPLVRADGSPGYQVIQGTSFASPHVAAAIGYLASLAPSAQVENLVAALKSRSRTDIGGSTTPRLDVFEAAVTLPGVLERLLDVNGPLIDGNERVVYGNDGVSLGPDEIRASATPGGPRFSAPDGRVDLRDFRVFRDAFLDGCRRGDLTSPVCPPTDQIALDGDMFHPKFDTNLDGCIRGEGVVGCDRSELLYSRLDFNGDGLLDDNAIRFPLTAGGSIAAAGTGTQMTDLDVFASRWGTGAGADTGGYAARDLGRLLNSGDVQVRFDQLWAEGATSAEVYVTSSADPENSRTFVATPPTSASQIPWRSVTVPLDPTAGTENFVQVRVVADLPEREDPAIFLSPFVDLGIGGDVVVTPCANQLTFTADPVVPEPGGSSTLTARLVDCLGNPVVGEELEFEITEGPNGSSISRVEALTDADGVATTVFDMPLRVIDEAQVVVKSYPAIGGGERLQAFVNIGEEFFEQAGATVYFSSREIIEEYERISTNDWAEDADDCDGPIDATGSPAGCFFSTQRFAFPDRIDVEPGVIAIDRRGLISLGNGVGDAEITTETRIFGGPESPDPIPGESYDFVPLVTDVTEWPAGNIGASQNEEIFSGISITSLGQSSMDWSALATTPLPAVTHTVDGNGLRVFGLSSFNDDFYFSSTNHRAVDDFYPDLHPDVPIGQAQFPEILPHRQQIPTQLGLLERLDGTAFPFAADVDGPLTVRRSANGSFQTYTYCARNDRSLSGGGGYWSDASPLRAWGRDPDDQRYERLPGDRAAPQHSGYVRGKVSFVAVVSLDGTPPPPGALDAPPCEPEGLNANFTVSPTAIQEGRLVRFAPPVGRTGENDRLEYRWLFGDGNESTEASPEHVYEDSGDYIVTLFVEDPEGGTGVASRQITVANTPPILTVDAVRPSAGGAELDITIGEWSLVDGLGVTVAITGSGGFPTVPATPYPVGSHTIALGAIAPGTYNVVVTAIDKDGAVATRTFQLAVSAASPSGASPIQPFAPRAATATTAPPATDLTDPPVSGLRMAMSGLVTQASPGSGDPFTTVAVPAFVLSRVTATTDDTIDIRNASISGGALVGTVFDLGDGRSTVPIDAGATRPVTYSAAVETTVSTVLAGTSAHTDLTVTGAAVVPVVAVGPASASTGYVGQSVVVRATVAAQVSGARLAGRPVTFRVGTATVDAVSDVAGVAEAPLTLAGPAGIGTLEVTVLATDSDSGATASAPFTVLANAPPTASAGGPYDVPILGDLVLNATGTDNDPDDAAALGFAWDLDGDGEFDDATGRQPLIPAASVASVICGGTCRSDQVDEISVRVTDPKGVAAMASTTVRSVADFTLGLSPGIAALGPFQQASIRVDVRSFNEFDGLVALTAPSLPTGVTASFSPPSVRPNGESVLTLTAFGSATPTTDPVALIVRGTSGSVVRETTGSLDVNFALVPRCTGTVAGTVTNVATGQPVGPGVTVRIGTNGTLTDDSGRYSIEGIPVSADNGPRIYDVTATAATGEVPFLTQGRTTFVSCTTTTFDFTVTPARFGSVTGTVRFADQNGVLSPFVPPTSGIMPQVQMFTVGGNRSAPLDAQGRYRFDNVALNNPNLPTSASPRIQFTGRHLAQSQGTVRAGEETVIDLVATQICTGSIRVRVIDGVTGLTRAGARVRYGTNPVQTANANGIVLLTGVPLGSPDNRAINHNVTAFGPVGDNRSAAVAAMLPRCGATTPVDVRLPVPTTPSSATLRATIVDDETGLPVPGMALRTSGGATSPTTSGPDGVVSWVISLGAFQTGNVVVSAEGSNVYFPSPTQNVGLTAGTTRNVEFRVLRRKFGVVSGTVTDAFTGLPLAGVPVNDSFRTTTTDENGRYELVDLGLNAGNQPAQRFIRARPDAALYWERTISATVAAAPPSTTVDFALVPVCRGATVRGRVINASTGQPLEGAFVNIAGLQQTTGADGLFAFTDLRVGSQNTPATWGINAGAPGFVTASRTVTIFCGADIVVDFGAPTTNATIEGRVIDEGGDPVSGVFVGSGFGGSAVTDANGEYRIASAPAPLDGTDQEWTVAFQPAFGSGLQDASRPAIVRAGQTTIVNVTLLATGGEPPNQRPTAVVSGPTTAVEGDTVTLTATGSTDTDGTITTVQWDLDGNGSFETAVAAVGSEVSVTRPDDATVTVGLRVTDDDGAVATTTHTIRFSNAPPTVTLAADLVVAGGRVTRTGSVLDLGTADVLDATIDVGDGDPPESLTLTPDGPGRYTFDLDVEFATPGLRTVAVTVCDDDHAPGAQPPVVGCDTETFQVTIVLPNRPPVATPGTVTTRANQPIAITLAGTDLDGDDLTAAVVDEPEHGTLTGTPPNLQYIPDADYVGPDRLTFTVSDGDATSEPAAIAITVSAANVAPTAVVAGPTSAVEGGTVSLTAAGSNDVDGTIAVVEWDLDDDGTFDPPVVGVGIPVTVSRRDDGDVTVRLRITDDEGATGTTSHVVRFANAVPVITLADNLAIVDGRVTRSGVATDAGIDDTHTATIDVDTGDVVPGVPLALVPDGAGRYIFAIDHTYPTPGPRTISITVCDDDHAPSGQPPVEGCATSTFAIEVPPPRVNQPPVAVVTGPTTALEGQTVVLSAETSRDDRAIASYAWDIGNDSTIDGTGTTQSVTARNDGPVTVSLTVTDDEGATATTTHVVTFSDVPAQIVLNDDLVIAEDGTVTRSGRLVDPGLDDIHVVTVDWGDGSPVETVTVTDRSFALRHRYVSPAGPLLGAADRAATLQGTFVVVVTACDLASPTSCGTGTFEVGSAAPPPTADLGVLVRPILAPSLGQRIDVGITVTNAGPSPAVDVVLTITLPPGTSTPGVDRDGWRCSASDLLGVVRCAPLVPELAVGAWALSLPVDVGIGAATQLRFEATVRSATTDPTAANNQASGAGDVVTGVVPPIGTTPVANVPTATTPSVVTPAQTPTIPTGGLPATGNSTSVALQIQLAALAAVLGLALRTVGRGRRRRL
jgi:PKD repeat protein